LSKRLSENTIIVSRCQSRRRPPHGTLQPGWGPQGGK